MCNDTIYVRIVCDALDNTGGNTGVEIFEIYRELVHLTPEFLATLKFFEVHIFVVKSVRFSIFQLEH